MVCLLYAFNGLELLAVTLVTNTLWKFLSIWSYALLPWFLITWSYSLLLYSIWNAVDFFIFGIIALKQLYVVLVFDE